MNIITYMLLLIAVYLICTWGAIRIAKDKPNKELRNISIVNIIFIVLMLFMYVVMKQLDELAVTFFKFIT